MSIFTPCSTIITCAIAGGDDNAHKRPAIPVTPAQIAAESLPAQAAGASIVHLHVRDPATGRPSRQLALYREVVARIRDAGTDLLIKLTTGPGAKVIPGVNPGASCRRTTPLWLNVPRHWLGQFKLRSQPSNRPGRRY